VVGREQSCACDSGNGIRVCELSGQWSDCTCRQNVASGAAASGRDGGREDAAGSSAAGNGGRSGSGSAGAAAVSGSAGRAGSAAGGGGRSGAAGSGAGGRLGGLGGFGGWFGPAGGTGAGGVAGPTSPRDAGRPAASYEACRRDRDCQDEEHQCFRPQGMSGPGPGAASSSMGYCTAACDDDEDCPSAGSGNARPVCRDEVCLLDCRDPGAECPDDMRCMPLGEGGRPGSYCLRPPAGP
jgi:hypothetical protein